MHTETDTVTKRQQSGGIDGDSTVERRAEARISRPGIGIGVQRRGWSWILGFRHCTVSDTSSAGISFHSDSIDVPKGHAVDLRIVIEGRKFAATGYIRDRRAHRDTFYYNVCFLNVEPQLADALRSYVLTSAERHPAMPAPTRGHAVSW